ncbi:hypothetical protein DTO027B5_196 [Paecilomyces variotii]|nr:hypothetical protein DTO032I3_6814 [Paecilomyces variotii]KAJ9220759.1 hypothetical protein DTO169C6_6844 [Paecilomyces variotii]KAJ9278111.1 hypothetical protein DTO021D3_5078 [Paecilomyces variotii]KAJ9290572.1 hypothetical protein DTO021C3_1837 [Paecilomyces variotii]KAJ9326569.1 hypothetical protein DTO027B3_2560 [Paecilomyces variotii]
MVTEATLTAAFLDLAFVTPENSHDNIVALLPDVSPSRHLYPPPTIARSLRLRFSFVFLNPHLQSLHDKCHRF